MSLQARSSAKSLREIEEIEFQFSLNSSADIKPRSRHTHSSIPSLRAVDKSLQITFSTLPLLSAIYHRYKYPPSEQQQTGTWPTRVLEYFDCLECYHPLEGKNTHFGSKFIQKKFSQFAFSKAECCKYIQRNKN